MMSGIRGRPVGEGGLSRDAVAWLLAAALSAWGCERSALDEPPASAARPLPVAEAVTGTLAAGRSDVWAFDVAASTLVEVEADSLEVDLALTLRAADGAEVAKLTTQAFNVPEPLLAVADASGPWRLEVRLADGETRAGGYRLLLATPSPVLAAGRVRVSAQKHHAAALALSIVGETATNERALELFERAAEGWREAGDRGGTARSLLWSGLMLKDLKRYEEAERRLLRSLDVWREVGSISGEGETLYRLGTLRRLWQRHDSALEALAGALPLFRAVGDRRREAFTLYNQGLVHRRQASMQQALELYDSALVLWRELGDRAMEARTINNIAVVRQLLGQGERAIEDLERVLVIYEEEGDTVSQHRALNNIGWALHRGLGEPGTAIDYFRRALGLVAEENLRDRSGYLINLARARVELGDASSALADAENARSLAAEARNRDHEIGSLIVMGQARHALGEREAAAALLLEAVTASRRLGLRSRESEALYRLARTRRAQGRIDEALEAIGRSLAILESVRADVDSRSLKSTFLAYRRPYYELEVRLLVEKSRSEGTSAAAGRALEASERARARGLLETLAAARADLTRGVDLTLLEEDLELRRRINEEDLRRWSATPEERRAIERELAELFDRLERVERGIRRASPQFAALTRPKPLELGRVQAEVLDGDSLLLEYSLGGDAGYLFAVTDDGIEIFDLPPTDVVEAAAREVYEHLTDRQGWLGSGWREHGEAYWRAAGRLSSMVLGPVADRLPGKRLLIAPEGALHYVPFAALPVPGADGRRPLVVDHEVVHLPSASTVGVLRSLSAGRRPAEGVLGVLADPVFNVADPRLRGRLDQVAGLAVSPAEARVPSAGGLEFRRLPHSRREAENIAALVAPDARWVGLDFEASRAAAMSRELGRYRIVHFATHGVLDGRTPQLSGLTLSLVDETGAPVDGFLRLHEIYQLELGADLVVLSACQTALGRAIRGEGLVGLVRGFLHAGAQSVVASLWRIEDDATAQLMERLYSRLLLEGAPVGDALRRAQIEMLQGELDPRWRSPYFWAAFVVQGEWRERPVSREVR